jgi:rubrerythrin
MIEVEALKLALSKEESSIKLYQRLIGKHPALKEVLYDLLNEELQHKKKIEDKIRELTQA